MIHKKKLLAFCLSAVFWIVSCSNNELQEEVVIAEASNPQNIDLVESFSLINSVTVENGMLRLQSIEQYSALIDELQALDASWIDESDSSSYSEALDEFENSLGFYSLRKDLDIQEQQFLDAGGEDWTLNPAAVHMISDDYERAILNPNLEIKIGSSIFKHIDREVIVEITDGDLDMLGYVSANFLTPEDILNTSGIDITTPNVIVHWGSRNWRIGGGPTVEFECGSQQISGDLVLFGEAPNSSDPLVFSFTENVSNLVANSNWQLQGYELRISSTASNNPPNISQMTLVTSGLVGQLGTYSHTFSAHGTYWVALTQSFQNNITNCSETVYERFTTEVCSRANDSYQDEDEYDNNTQRVWGKTKIVNNVFMHRIKVITKHYRKKSNGKWTKDKADYIGAGIVAGTGNSKIYTQDAQGQFTVAHEFPIQGGNNPWNDGKSNKNSVTYIYSSPFTPKKFVVYHESVAGAHWVEDDEGNILLSLFTRITPECD